MTLLQFAAILSFLLGLAHSYLGERYILTRLFRRDNLPAIFGSSAFTTQTLRFAWHLTTVLFWAFAAILWLAGSGGITQSGVLRVIGHSCIASGFLPLLITRGKHLSWIVIFVIGAIALYGSGSGS